MEQKHYTLNGRNYAITPLVTTKRGLHVDINDGYLYCVSYYTVVCVYDIANDVLIRTWTDYSATTAKHIGTFLRMVNSEYGTHYSYYDWKNAITMARIECKFYPLDWLVNNVRSLVKCPDSNWW